MTSLARTLRMASSLTVTLLVLLALFAFPATTSIAQSAAAPAASLQQRIHGQLARVQDQSSASPREQGSQWALLGAEYAEAAQFTSAENAYNNAIQLLSQSPADTELHAEALDQLAALYRIYSRLPEALNCTRQAQALRVQSRQPLAAALSQSHVAEILLIQHKYKEAFTDSDTAYQAMAHQPGASNSGLLSTIIVRAYALCGMHKHTACLAAAEQALTTARNAFPADSQPIGAAFAVLGSAQFANGSIASAEESFGRALDIFKASLAPNDPRLIYALQRYRECLHTLHQEEEEREVSMQLQVLSHQPPGPCPGCTVSGYALRAPVK